MTPRQRVRAAFAREPVDATPFSWGFGPTPEESDYLRGALRLRGIDWERFRAAADDVVQLNPRYAGPPLAEGQPEYMAIWGIRTRRADYGGGAYDEIAESPLAGVADPAELDDVPWPSTDWYDYDSLVEQLEEKDRDGLKAVRVKGGHLLEIYTWMTGMEETMINLALNPALVRAGLRKVTDFYKANLQRVAEVLGDRLDIIFFADDLGGQEGLLISREMYRDILQPVHRDISAFARQVAPRANQLFHSDGAVFPILADVIDAGFDGLDAVQVDAAGMDPERLKQTYGKQLLFHGGISVQALLPQGPPDRIRDECRRLCRVFGQGGGYIAAPSHAIQFGTPADHVLAMAEAVLGEERFAAACKGSVNIS